MHPVPILTYHATNITGNDYVTNDHVALAADLRLIDTLGYTIVPLECVVHALLEGASLPDKALAITLDDGTDFDYRDILHPSYGMQQSMFNILDAFRKEAGITRQPWLHITSFVIVSPEARQDLDAYGMAGTGWFNHDWWIPAARSGRMAIANHSWDHNLSGVRTASPRIRRDTFTCIDTPEQADFQIRQARDFIRRLLPRHAPVRLFAYPFGEGNDFLLKEYFPRGCVHTGTLAAFSTEPAPVGTGANRWFLPRYVCGQHWNSPQALEYLLNHAV